MLAMDHCFDLDPVVFSKLMWLGTRSPIPTNWPNSIFSTRLSSTGGIVAPADDAEVIG